MPLITTDTWQLRTDDLLHKQALMAFAASCGVPVVHPLWGHDTDGDAYLNWWSEKVGIGSLPHRLRPELNTELIDPAQFTAMCRAYQQAHAIPA